jgi:hypothetical protein
LKPKKVVEKKIVTVKPSVQDRMDEKGEELTGKILNMMDEYIGNIKDIKKGGDLNQVNIESFLNVEEVKPLIAKRIFSEIEYASKEWDEVVSSSDLDIKEAYSYLTPSEHKRIQRMYKKVLDELSARAVQTRKRRTRKKKVKTPQEIVSAVKYQESFNGVTSIKPEKIIGMNKVILFNTKYREFQIIESSNDKIGLNIEGTTIKGINKTTSVCKRVREQYVETLLNVSQVKGIRAILNEYKSIKAKENTPTRRLNDSTIIVRVLK